MLQGPFELQEGRMLTRDRPADPLKMLGEFLLEKSKEMEGAMQT